ncbi:hypothetical protein Bca101_056974 [Brassica carinata]
MTPTVPRFYSPTPVARNLVECLAALFLIYSLSSPPLYTLVTQTPGKGFYKVYFDVFNRVYLNEINFARTLGLKMDSVREAPVMGNLESPYAQVTAFYNYWLGFSTVMDFCWVDEYDVMAGPNRRMGRKMEEENKKVRKKAKREYNETVRGLAAFVKKRDKRVIDMMVKKSAEMEVKKSEERERKKKMEKERLERTMRSLIGQRLKMERRKGKEWRSKKFKSEKQWKNHEQSKKHKEKVAELRKSFSDVEEEKEEEDDEEEIDEALETVEEIHEKIQEGFNIQDEADETDDEYFMAEEDVKGSSESEDDDADEEMSLLKKMVSRQKNKRKNVVSRKEDEFVVEINSDRGESSELDNQRNKRNVGKDTTENADKVQLAGDDCNNTDDNMNATDSASGAFEDSQKDKQDSIGSTGRRRRSKKGKNKNNLGRLMEKSSEADDTQDRNGDMEESHSETFEGRSEYTEHKKAPRLKKSTKGMKSKVQAFFPCSIKRS